MYDLIDRQGLLNKICDGCGYIGYCHPGRKKCVEYERVESMPSVEPEQQWIPCSERLPEEEYVLISKQPTKLSGGKWCVTIAIRMTDPRSSKIHWRDIGFGVIQDNEVLAWMPLPEPYKESENG